MKKLTLIVMALSLFVSACSNQWREGDTGLTSEEVGSMLDEAVKGTSASGFSTSQMTDLRDDPATAVFFAEAPGSLGSVASILSLMSFEFLGSSYANKQWWSFKYARVFLLDTPTSSGRKAVLILGLQEGTGSNLTYHTFAGDSSIESGEYLAVLYDKSGNEKLVLRSFDTDGDDDLQTVVQIKVSDFDSGGNERYIGKFSTMVGYGR